MYMWGGTSSHALAVQLILLKRRGVGGVWAFWWGAVQGIDLEKRRVRGAETKTEKAREVGG